MSQVNVDFYTNTADAWESMLADIRSAKKSISIEQYIFAVDSIGRRFVELLYQKAEEGLKIRLVCDMVGSYGFYNSITPALLREKGIEIKFFNKVSPWRIKNFTSNLFRDHRKIMIIDEETAHIGGVGVQEHMATWRDTHMRIVGPIVDQVVKSFDTVWNAHLGFYVRYKKNRDFVDKYELLVNAPSLRQRYIHRSIIANIKNAKKYVYLTTPYFIPDMSLYRAIRMAAKRGVDVRILMPEHTDYRIVNYARDSYLSIALKAGVKIYNYTPSMMHAKAAVVDDVWATAGSFNLDSLSVWFNHEANIASTDENFIAQLKNHFVTDLNNAKEVLFADWIKRPLRRKIIELLTWPFHSII